MENIYKYEIVAGDASKAVIALKDNVLGGSDALSFTNCLDEINNKGMKCIIIDCSGVKLINSSGLGMLIGGHSFMKKLGGFLVLAAVPQKVLTLLEMTHLNNVFTIFPSIEDALKCEK